MRTSFIRRDAPLWMVTADKKRGRQSRPLSLVARRGRRAQSQHTTACAISQTPSPLLSATSTVTLCVVAGVANETVLPN
jgi:hypothetical protein